MKVKYCLKRVPEIIVPERANDTDAGYDIIATSEPKIVGEKTEEGNFNFIDYVEYETNLYFVPQADWPHQHDNFHTDLRPRSSISSKTNFVLANSVGLIDRGYHHQVLVRFKYIWQPTDMWWGGEIIDNGRASKKRIFGKPNTDKMYKKGDRICQMLPIQTHDIHFEIVDELPVGLVAQESNFN
jgi:dUTPase